MRRGSAGHGVVYAPATFATASLLQKFIDETERRTWFLYETIVGGEHTK